MAVSACPHPAPTDCMLTKAGRTLRAGGHISVPFAMPAHSCMRYPGADGTQESMNEDRSQAYILSGQPPPPPHPGPHAPPSCRVMAVWMSTWAEFEGPPGAADAKSLGQAGEVRGLGGCLHCWQYLGERAELRAGGRWVRSRPTVRWLCQQSARTPLLPQWPHCSQPPGSLEEVPRPP